MELAHHTSAFIKKPIPVILNDQMLSFCSNSGTLKIVTINHFDSNQILTRPKTPITKCIDRVVPNNSVINLLSFLASYSARYFVIAEPKPKSINAKYPIIDIIKVLMPYPSFPKPLTSTGVTIRIRIIGQPHTKKPVNIFTIILSDRKVTLGCCIICLYPNGKSIGIPFFIEYFLPQPEQVKHDLSLSKFPLQFGHANKFTRSNFLFCALGVYNL